MRAPRGVVGMVSLLLMMMAMSAHAHEIRPAVATAVFTEGRYRIELAANLEALLAQVGPQHAASEASPSAARYEMLRALPPRELRRRFDAFHETFSTGVALEFDRQRSQPRIESVDIPEIGDTRVARLSRVVLSGAIPPGARVFQWTYAPAFGASVLRIQAADGVTAQWLAEGRQSAPYPLATARQEAGRAEIAVRYLTLGFSHILPLGLDHILFVLGLFLLSPRLRPLLIQISAFTVAHTLTLALSLYEVLALSPRVVEPLIALSIIYVAVENIVTPRLHPWRPFVVFGFGLLHGMGFAGVLKEIGLPRSEFLTGLLGFNLGVELGQLAVIVLAYLLIGRWCKDPQVYRARVARPASAMIALTGVYWTAARVLA